MVSPQRPYVEPIPAVVDEVPENEMLMLVTAAPGQVIRENVMMFMTQITMTRFRMIKSAAPPFDPPPLVGPCVGL